MSVAEKLTAIAENQQKVYDAGYAQGCNIVRSVLDRSITAFQDDSIESLGAYAFCKCSALESVALPQLSSADTCAFIECTSLTEIELPALKNVAVSMFAGATALKTVSLPEAEYMFGRAFNGCSALTSVSADKLAGIDSYAFLGCTGLTSVRLPSCTYVYNNAFQNCTGLETVDLGELATAEMVSNLANGVFMSAFQNCPALTALILRTSIPGFTMTLGSTSAFNGTPIAAGTGYIYVPEARLSAYQSATNWSVYADQIRAIEDYPDITGG